MDETQMKKLISRAKGVAVRRGFSHEKDDFSQDAILKILAGRKATFDQLLIDYLRQRYNRSTPRTKKKTQKIDCYNVVEIQEWMHPLFEDQFVQEGLDEILKILDKRKFSKSRTMLILKYLWGFKDCEIAYCFNVTPGRISQLMHSAFSYIKEHYSKGD